MFSDNFGLKAITVYLLWRKIKKARTIVATTQMTNTGITTATATTQDFEAFAWLSLSASFEHPVIVSVHSI